MNNTALNVVNNISPSNTKTQIILLVVVGLAILVLGYYYTQQRAAPAPYLDSSGMLHPAPEQPVAAYNTSEVPTITKASWCLVAEDNSGRYCVKVPGPESCTPDRAYDSQSQCELTPAMKLPAAIQTNSGMTSKPLRELKVL
jgi:hypothetical protein